MKEFLRYAIILGCIIFGLYMLYPAFRPVNEKPTVAVTPTNNPSPAVSAVSTDNVPSVPGPSVAAPTTTNPDNGSIANLAASAGSPAPIDVDTNTMLAPAANLEVMRQTIHSYNSQFGQNPVGDNAEITRALMGDNSRHLNFIQPDSGLRVNANGELVDAWGTPFFFHQISGQIMEIHSAGPDRKMWTSDDSVTR